MSRAGWSSRTSPRPNPRSSSMACSSRAAWRALSRSLARAAVTSAENVYERSPVTSTSRAWASGAGTANQTALPRSPQLSSRARVGWCPHRPPDSSCTIWSPRPLTASAYVPDTDDTDGGAVSPAAGAVEDLADQLASGAQAAQVQPELGLGNPGRLRRLRVAGNAGRAVSVTPVSPRRLRGRAGGHDRLALHVRDHGREPIPPSAGPGHRLRVQRIGREFAGHQDAVLEQVGLETDLRDRVPERLPRHRRACGVGRKRPRVAGARVNASPTANTLLPYTRRHRRSPVNSPPAGGG